MVALVCTLSLVPSPWYPNMQDAERGTALTPELFVESLIAPDLSSENHRVKNVNTEQEF